MVQKKKEERKKRNIYTGNKPPENVCFCHFHGRQFVSCFFVVVVLFCFVLFFVFSKDVKPKNVKHSINAIAIMFSIEITIVKEKPGRCNEHASKVRA